MSSVKCMQHAHREISLKFLSDKPDGFGIHWEFFRIPQKSRICLEKLKETKETCRNFVRKEKMALEFFNDYVCNSDQNSTGLKTVHQLLG